MRWIFKATGHMTLSVLDENEFQILKVDMLACNTMEAGKDGDILLRTYNDLSIIAGFTESKYEINMDSDLPYPEAGTSPIPWVLDYSKEKRFLKIKSGKRTIADRTFPKLINEEKVQQITDTIDEGIRSMTFVK